MIRAAATVVLLRQGEGGDPEVLLLERHPDRHVHGGGWVFPGGGVDPIDEALAREEAGGEADDEAIARQAAARETEEEAGLRIEPSALRPLSRWITPEGLARRYDARFFIAAAPPDPIRVDGEEIVGYRWLRPGDAIRARSAGELALSPPTFVTLVRLLRRPRIEASSPLPFFLPRICSVAQGLCALYPGDAGYESQRPELEGSRHRLWILPEGWRYEPPLETPGSSD
ncbi:MAG: NUDIX domain-containing protein [Myxococcales bacterium]|nr:NUDIX domain-containing protein [Myxococcales bacterium]